MLAAAAGVAIGAVLVVAALLKLAAPRRSAAALSSHGFPPGPLRWAAWASLVAIELGLGIGIAVGSAQAARLAAAILAVFALLLLAALMRGRAGEPCACFGAASTIGWPGILRTMLLAVACAVLPAL